MTRIDRRALFASGSAAALLAAAGVSSAATPKRGGHLRAALSGGDRSERWTTLPGGHFLNAARNAVFETLTEIAPDGTLQPGLATRWASEDGGLVWHFDLAEDVRFHDGTHLTAEDVAASLALAGFKVRTGAHRITVLLLEQDPALPFRLSDGVMIYSARELEAGDPVRLGTGLYAVHRFEAGRNFLGRRVECHRKDGRAGWFDTVELVSMSDPAARAAALRDGYVDVTDFEAPYDLEGRPDIRLTADAALRQDIQTASRTAPSLDALRFAERWWMQT